tara:strand:+ start:5266 stop:8313 length:3048 start_codon:yes stop_codon:yes gene_type:complete
MVDLDELLQSIRDEGKREQALTVYEGTRQDDLVDEEIDERILRLLGLEEVFDIDYSTYLTLLKEKMAAGRMSSSKLATEETELLTDEFKRVKRKVGRFTIKKTTVDNPNITPIRAKNFISPSNLGSANQLEPAVDEPKKENQAKNLDYLLQITESLRSIQDILKNQSKVNSDIRESERKQLEKERRKTREQNREKKKKSGNFLKNLKDSLPKLGVFGMIGNFIKNVLLGKAIFSLLQWMSDPDNKKKLEAIGNFLKDWWPALTAAVLMFVTPLGVFVKGMVSSLVGLTTFLLGKTAGLLKLAAANPIATAALLTAGAGIALALRSKDGTEQQLEDKGMTDATPKEKADELSKPFSIMETFTRGILPSLNDESKVEGRSGGGLVGFSGGGHALASGTDTVPAMLTPGEFVMSKGAVDKIGANNLMKMNADGGGTNEPKYINNTTYAAGGGLVDAFSFLPGTGTVMAPRASKGQYADEGTTVQKFLGMEIPGSMRRSRYTPEDIERYNRLDTGDPSRQLSTFDAMDKRYESLNEIYGQYGQVPTSKAVKSGTREVPMIPTNTSPQTSNSKSKPPMSEKERNDRFIGESFKNFGDNVNTIKSRNQKMVEQMGKLGIKPDGYVNPFGSPVTADGKPIKAKGYSGGGLGTDTVPAMLTPGEFVMSKGAVNKFGLGTMMNMNKAGGGTNKPKLISGQTFAAGGGAVPAAPQGPKISDSDFATLLAITALEDTNPQGRADVAQSLYNRLYSVNNYGSNYNQSSNSLKNIITAQSEGGAAGGGQYEPTFGNPDDWKNIMDKESAARAIMNSKKGRDQGFTMELAMQQLLDTEKALSNPDFQKNAREHVQGRTYFLGTSQQDNMQEGDVLRSPEQNFFSMWYDETSQYGKERANIASPMPQRLIQPSTLTPTTPAMPAGPKGLMQSLTDEEGLSGFYMKPINAILGNKSQNNAPIDKNVRSNIPGPPSRSSKPGIINLPPIQGGSMSNNRPGAASATTEPMFPTVSKLSAQTRRRKVDTYGVGR